MTQDGHDNYSYRFNIGKRRLVLTAALLQATKNIHRVDELFQWLAASIVQQFGVYVVQFWVGRATYNGQYTMQILALASKDNSLPQRIALSESIANLAEHIIVRRSVFEPEMVDSAFPYFQANLLQRFGLSYCSGEYLSFSALASSARLPDERKRMRMEVAALHFFAQQPPPELQRSISYILQLATQIAEANGLFQPVNIAPSHTVEHQPQVQQNKVPALFKLVPHRRAETELMTTSTPLAGSFLITDKLARRLYQSIDGRKTIEDLRAITHLDNQEIVKALRTLLAERRIELLDLHGQPVESALFFTDL